MSRVLSLACRPGRAGHARVLDRRGAIHRRDRNAGGAGAVAHAARAGAPQPRARRAGSRDGAAPVGVPEGPASGGTMRTQSRKHPMHRITGAAIALTIVLSAAACGGKGSTADAAPAATAVSVGPEATTVVVMGRSEEHTSELQSLR